MNRYLIVYQANTKSGQIMTCNGVFDCDKFDTDSYKCIIKELSNSNPEITSIVILNMIKFEE